MPTIAERLWFSTNKLEERTNAGIQVPHPRAVFVFGARVG